MSVTARGREEHLVLGNFVPTAWPRTAQRQDSHIGLPVKRMEPQWSSSKQVFAASRGAEADFAASHAVFARPDGDDWSKSAASTRSPVRHEYIHLTRIVPCVYTCLPESGANVLTRRDCVPGPNIRQGISGIHLQIKTVETACDNYCY